MRFKRHPRSSSQSPQVELVPMMDVLMCILTFFIITSMSLQGSSKLNVDLPGAVSAAFSDRPPGSSRPTGQPLVVELSLQKQIAVNKIPVSSDQLIQQVQSYLAQNPQGKVLLKADRALTYADVSGLLKTMRDVGGDRVSLAISSSP